MIAFVMPQGLICVVSEYDIVNFYVLETCAAGEQPTADQSECENCPVGTYKSEANQLPCTPCPTGEITGDIGSTSDTECSGNNS